MEFLVHKCLDVDIGKGGHEEHAVTPGKEIRKEDTSSNNVNEYLSSTPPWPGIRDPKFFLVQVFDQP